MKKTVILLLFALSCIFSMAQDAFNCLDVNLNNVNDVRCIPCGSHGFCMVKSSLISDSLRIEFERYDTLMQKLSDTSLFVDASLSIAGCNYENGEVLLLLKTDVAKKQSLFSVVIIGLDDNYILVKKLLDNQAVMRVENLCHFSGNLLFSTKDKDTGDYLWFMPSEGSETFPFDFNQRFRMRLLSALADGESGEFVFCVSADGKTFYFQTDPRGKSIFANVIQENSTAASINKISKGHYLMTFNDEKEDVLILRIATVLDNKLSHKSFLNYYLRGDSRHSLEKLESLTSGKLLTAEPYNAVFSPASCFTGNGMLAEIVDVYIPEYEQYYNGHFYDTRFYGYRHQHANVVFYDTNGNFVTSMKMPFNDSQMIHSSAFSKTRVSFLGDGHILLYFMDDNGFTTQLLDSKFEVADPVRTDEIPLRSRVYKKRNAEVDFFVQWYGASNFLLGAKQFSADRKNKPLGYIVNKLIYE